MQNLVFLTYLFQKLSKKNLWGVGSTPPPPLGTGRVNNRACLTGYPEITLKLSRRTLITSPEALGVAIHNSTLGQLYEAE